MTITFFNRRRGFYGKQLVKITENIEPRPLTSRRRTGRAIYIDTFENYFAVPTEKWLLSGSGTPTLTLESDYPKDGKYYCKLGTTATATHGCIMTKHMGAFPKQRFGVEFDLMSNSTLTNLGRLDFYLYYYDGADLISFIIRYLGEASKKFQYYTTGGAYTDIPSGDYDLEIEAVYHPVWHNFKLIGDVVNGNYVKFICNEKEYILTDLPARVSSSAFSPMITVAISIVCAQNVAIMLGVDNLIITDEE